MKVTVSGTESSPGVVRNGPDNLIGRFVQRNRKEQQKFSQ